VFSILRSLIVLAAVAAIGCGGRSSSGAPSCSPLPTVEASDHVTCLDYRGRGPAFDVPEALTLGKQGCEALFCYQASQCFYGCPVRPCP
jgi:hypothetical protein